MRAPMQTQPTKFVPAGFKRCFVLRFDETVNLRISGIIPKPLALKFNHHLNQR